MRLKIDFDVTGRVRTRVPKDWREAVLKTRRVLGDIREDFGGRDGIASFAYSPGRYGGDNPHVRVGLEEGNPESEERRGEIPAEEDGVRIETFMTGEGVADCSPEYHDADYIPGGLQVEGSNFDTGNTTGSNSQTSRTAVGTLAPITQAGLGTALHIWDDCPTGSTDTWWVHRAAGLGPNVLGEIGWVAPEYDFVYIETKDSKTPLSEVGHPEHPSNVNYRDDIVGTLSSGGVDDIIAMGENTVKLRGSTTCEIFGTVHSHGSSKDLVSPSFCQDSVEKCAFIEYSTEPQGGDSGGLWYTEPISAANNDRYALCLHSGHTLIGDAFGSTGYAIRDDYNTWWGPGGI